MRHSSWTLRSIDHGETGHVETGLSREQAVVAIDRAMRGLDPFDERVQPLRAVSAKHSERQPAGRVAA